MKAIVLLGHGSNVPGAGAAIEGAAEILSKKYKHDMVEVCHLSRVRPFFPETLEKCVGAGATEVMLIPCFLYSGIHIKKDIPDMMKAEAVKYPDVKIVLGEPLGFDEMLVDVVQHRIGQSADYPDIRETD